MDHAANNRGSRDCCSCFDCGAYSAFSKPKSSRRQGNVIFSFFALFIVIFSVNYRIYGKSFKQHASKEQVVNSLRLTMPKRKTLTLSAIAALAVFFLLLFPFIVIPTLAFAGETTVPSQIQTITTLIAYSDINAQGVTFQLESYTFHCASLHSNFQAGRTSGNVTIQELTVTLQNCQVTSSSVNASISSLDLTLYLQSNPNNNTLSFYAEASADLSLWNLIVSALQNSQLR